MQVCLARNDASPGARADQLASSRGTYRYAWDWPIGVATSAELPAGDNYGLGYVAHSVKIYAEIGANLAAMAIEGASHDELEKALRARFERLAPYELHAHLLRAPKDLAASVPDQRVSSWTEFERFFALWKAPEVLASFQSGEAAQDLAFAWQRVGGCNPMLLARCDRIPERFPIDAARYAALISGDSLQKALADQRLYLADYSVLDGVALGETDGLAKYLCAPLALFVVDPASRQLRPVAIQCGQRPGPDAPTMWPGEGWRWRMAKTLVQIADANWHEGVAHLGRTHLVMEAVKLAMERQLAKAHPLHVLLSPHLETTLAINHSAKTSLIARGGTVDRCFAPKIEAFGELVRTAIRTHPIDESTPARDLRARGLDNRDALPFHPYRDDALLVWDAIESFVGEYLALYYPIDDEVARDTELAAFATELCAEDGGRLVGVAVPKTIDALRALITRLIWIAGPQHSAVNFAQYPFMGLVPNMSGASYRAIPSADTPDDEAEYTQMLPPWRVATEGVTMIYLLSSLRDSKLGDYGLLHFLDLRVHPIVRALQKRLREVEATIVTRDPARLLSYPWLLPSQILQSISI